MKARDNGRVAPKAVIVAVGANTDGRREVLGMAVGPSEAETFSTSCEASPGGAFEASSW